jgi:hypothetical protein
MDNRAQQRLDDNLLIYQRRRIRRLNAELERTRERLFARLLGRWWPESDASRRIKNQIDSWRSLRLYSVAAEGGGVRIDLLIAGFALPPLWQTAMLGVRLLRRRRGSCAWCAYDLRASLGRCSECGRPAGAPLVDAELRMAWRAAVWHARAIGELYRRHRPILSSSQSTFIATGLYVCSCLSGILVLLATARAVQAWNAPQSPPAAFGSWLAWLLAATATGAIGIAMVHLGTAVERTGGAAR